VVFSQIEALSAPIFSVWRGRGFWAAGAVVIQISRRRISDSSDIPRSAKEGKDNFSGQGGTWPRQERGGQQRRIHSRRPCGEYAASGCALAEQALQEPTPENLR
jgi:hypothetical protein